MRKLTSSLLGLLFLAAACNKQDSKVRQDDQQADVPVITERRCAANEVLEQQMAADPTLRARMDQIEAYTQKVMNNPSAYKLVGDTIEIPVVVHVVYKTAQQNISDAQVKSQIDVLNEDYHKKNADGVNVPAEFNGLRSGAKVKFTLSQVLHKSTTKTSFTTNDYVKMSSKGGDNPVSPTTTLNMWACNLGQGLLGYAQFPGGSSSTDGVVILYSAFGSRAKYPAGVYTTSYDLGRTATHEVGHWLNLRHIWGDASCGNDLVNDTPVASTSNYGCPAYPHKSTCGTAHNEMTMNYMDYTDDACMNMFTLGQDSRIEAIFAVGGARATFR